MDTNSYLDHLSTNDILAQMPGFIFWKDKEGYFRGGNDAFIKAAGLQHSKELIGKNDQDMPWHEFAKEYAYWDRKVMQGGMLIYHRELHCQHNKSIITVNVNKKPLIDPANRIVGLIGTYTIIDNFMHQKIQSLPLQQRHCLHLLSKGLSNKMIADQMNLSVRTIEFYIQIIKKKWQCRNRAELMIQYTKYSVSE